MNINRTDTGSLPVPAGRSGDGAPIGAGAVARKGAEAPVQVNDPARDGPLPPRQQVRQAVAAINRAITSSSSSLKFTVDEATHEPIVRVMDTETGTLIRQIPSREALAIAASIDNFLERGALLTQKA